MTSTRSDLPVIAAPGAEADEAVVVRLGASELGLPIGRVREVVPVPFVTRVPFAPAGIVGVISVRGAVLPVLDLGDRLFGAPASREGRLVIATTARKDELVALLVDAVLGLVPLATRVDDPPPEIEASLPAGWVRAVLAPAEDRLIALLDLDAVLAREQTDEEAR